MDRWVAGLDGVFGYWLVWVDFLGGWEGRGHDIFKGEFTDSNHSQDNCITVIKS